MTFILMVCSWFCAWIPNFILFFQSFYFFNFQLSLRLDDNCVNNLLTSRTEPLKVEKISCMGRLYGIKI